MSTTLTVRMRVATLPAASCAVYVRTYEPATLTSTLPVVVTGTEPLQVSAAVAPGSVNDVCHSTVIISAPLSAIIGGGLETCTTVDAPLLGAVLGSAVVELTAAQLTIGAPFGVAQLTTATVRVNCAEAPTPNEAAVHNTRPVPPTAGVRATPTRRRGQ